MALTMAHPEKSLLGCSDVRMAQIVNGVFLQSLEVGVHPGGGEGCAGAAHGIGRAPTGRAPPPPHQPQPVP